MKYSITRKLNLGRLAGLQYEAIDLTIEECDTREQAMNELEVWIKELKEKINEQEMLNEFNSTIKKAQKERK